MAALDRDEVALRAGAEQLPARAHEVARVGLALEAEEVGTEETVEQLGAPGQLGEELDRGEGDVVEPPDAHVGPQLAHEGRHELQLVVLHPHTSALGRHLGHGLREALVDGLVARPPVAVEGGRHDDVVVDRPQGVVGEALVVVAHLVGRQRHRGEVDAVLVEGLGSLAGVTGPADPGAGLRAHDGLHGRDEPAGATPPLDLAAVGDDLVDGQAVRRDDEVIGRPCRRHAINSCSGGPAATGPRRRTAVDDGWTAGGWRWLAGGATARRPTLTRERWRPDGSRSRVRARAPVPLAECTTPGGSTRLHRETHGSARLLDGKSPS